MVSPWSHTRHYPPCGSAPVDYECENAVTCELHAWEVKMACSVLANSANEMIDTEMGKGDNGHRLRSAKPFILKEILMRSPHDLMRASHEEPAP